jgi:hypothetical protein
VLSPSSRRPRIHDVGRSASRKDLLKSRPLDDEYEFVKSHAALSKEKHSATQAGGSSSITNGSTGPGIRGFDSEIRGRAARLADRM